MVLVITCPYLIVLIFSIGTDDFTVEGWFIGTLMEMEHLDYLGKETSAVES